MFWGVARCYYKLRTGSIDMNEFDGSGQVQVMDSSLLIAEWGHATTLVVSPDIIMGALT